MLANTDKSFAVGDWLVQPDIDQISTATEAIYLRPQVMAILVYLADLQGQVATLDSIHDDLWPGKVVSNGTIYNCITELRRALSKDGKNVKYIETIPKKGYRLAAHTLTSQVVSAGNRNDISVAILPLTNHSKDAEIQYLCEGIAEEILHLLSNISGLKVYSAFTLREEQLESRVVGLRFSADMVLTGSLQSSGEKLRFSFRLENVSNGETVWSDRYDQTLTDVLDLQVAVAEHVVNTMSAAFNISLPNNTLPVHSGTQSLEAFNAFLLGKHALSNTTNQSYDEAIRYFEQAVTIDPTFARAHYRLYLANYMKRREYGADKVYLENARIAADNAKKNGYRPAVPWVHIQRRLYRNTQPGTRELALEAIDKIRHPDPDWGSFAYEQLTWVLSAAGYFKATLDFARHMLDSPLHNYQDSDADEELHGYYAAAGQLENAIHHSSVLIQKDPARPFFRMERAISYSRTGQFENARRDIDLIEDDRHLCLAQACYYFWKNQPDRVMEYHDRLCSITNIHPRFLLYTYSMTGDFDSGIEQYMKAVNSLERSYIDFGPLRAATRAKLSRPVINELEQHPGFKQLMEQEGINDAWREELMFLVNGLADITGIEIHPDDDYEQ